MRPDTCKNLTDGHAGICGRNGLTGGVLLLLNWDDGMASFELGGHKFVVEGPDACAIAAKLTAVLAAPNPNA